MVHISVECMGCLNEDVKKKRKKMDPTEVREVKIATSAKLLDIMHKPYEFSGDLKENINLCISM